MKTWRVIIPYYHEFIVEATDEDEAIVEAHNHDGKIISWDDSEAGVEEIEDEECCDSCGSTEIWRNSSGDMQCDNCGYSEEGGDDE